MAPRREGGWLSPLRGCAHGAVDAFPGEQGGLFGDSHVWLELYRKWRGTARCARGRSLRSPVCANTQEQGLDPGGRGALTCGVNLRAGQELHLGAELKRQRNLSNT